MIRLNQYCNHECCKGIFESVNGRASYSNRPKVVVKASFPVSFGWIGICQYLIAKSRVEKNFALPNSFKRVSIWDRDSAAVLVIVLSLWKSTQNCEW